MAMRGALSLRGFISSSSSSSTTSAGWFSRRAFQILPKPTAKVSLLSDGWSSVAFRRRQDAQLRNWPMTRSGPKFFYSTEMTDGGADQQETSLLKSLQTSKVVYEKDSSKWEELSTLLIKVGMYYESLQKEEKAEGFFRQAVELYDRHSPSAVAAHVILGNTLSRLDKLPEARDLFARAVEKLEARSSQHMISPSQKNGNASSLNMLRVQQGDHESHHHHHHGQDPSHDIKIGLVHAYDGFIKSKMRLEGIPSTLPLITNKLLPALKQLDAPQRVETLHEWLKICLSAQREIVELQTVPGIGDFSIANEISTLLLTSLQELQHSQGVLLDVLLDRAGIEFSQHNFKESLATVEKAMEVWRKFVRDESSEEIRNAVDMQLMLMIARRHHALSPDLAAKHLSKKTEQLADLRRRERVVEALIPEFIAAKERGEQIVPPSARERKIVVVDALPREQMEEEEGRDISEPDTSGLSEYDSVIDFYRSLQQKSSLSLGSPYSDLYVTALLGKYHLLVESLWFFKGENDPKANGILDRLRTFDARLLSSPDPLAISPFFITESVRYHSHDGEKFSLRMALVPRKSTDVYVEMSSPERPGEIIYKSQMHLQENKLTVIEVNDQDFEIPDTPIMKEVHLDIFESRAKTKRLAIHKDFVVPTKADQQAEDTAEAKTAAAKDHLDSSITNLTGVTVTSKKNEK